MSKLMHKGAPTIKTTVRIAKAILNEFGSKDGLKVIVWLEELIAAWGKITPDELGQIARTAAENKRWERQAAKSDAYTDRLAAGGMGPAAIRTRHEITVEVICDHLVTWCRARLFHALAGAHEQGVLMEVLDELLPAETVGVQVSEVVDTEILNKWVGDLMMCYAPGCTKRILPGKLSCEDHAEGEPR